MGPLEHKPGLADPPGCAGKHPLQDRLPVLRDAWGRLHKAVRGACDVVEGEGEVEEGHCGPAQEEKLRVAGVQEGARQEAPRALHDGELPALVLPAEEDGRRRRGGRELRGVTGSATGGGVLWPQNRRRAHSCKTVKASLRGLSFQNFCLLLQRWCRVWRAHLPQKMVCASWKTFGREARLYSFLLARM